MTQIQKSSWCCLPDDEALRRWVLECSKICVQQVLKDMCATGMLMKKSLFDSLKHAIVDEPKAKMWTTGAGIFVITKKAVISGCLLPLIMTKCIFSMKVNAMPDSDQLYAVIIGRDLMHQLQLKPDIIENTIWFLVITIPIILHSYWTKNRIETLSSRNIVKEMRKKKS